MQLLKVFFLILLSNSFVTFAQLTFYEDIVQGEICVLGSSSGDTNGATTQQTLFANNTPVDKFFVLCYGATGNNFSPKHRRFKINGIEFNIDTLPKKIIEVGNVLSTMNTDYKGHYVICLDLSAYFPVVNNSISIDWLHDANIVPPSNCPSCVISGPRIIIISKNIALPSLAYSIQVNNQKNNSCITLQTTKLSSADINFPIALGIHSDRLGGGAVNDGYKFYLNNIYAGKITNPDSANISIGGGAIGNFHYSNNTLTALTDDNVDSIFSSEVPPNYKADGLSTINGYLINQQINPLSIKFCYADLVNQVWMHNFFISYTLAYTTQCQPFDVSINRDTSVCEGSLIQLQATGGNKYEWQPSIGLSCSNCANPTLIADSSRLYTVRIWNSDSCSVVRSVMVNVFQKPSIEFIKLSNTKCDDQNGRIETSSSHGCTYSLNNTTWQSNSVFSNLSAGNYTIFLKDTNGCINDTTVVIGIDTLTQASFLISPATGKAPLTTSISNHSIHSNSYLWTCQGQISSMVEPVFTFDTAGTYIVTLVATINGQCADTFSLSVWVYDSLQVHIPNIITPNNDGTNDWFSIQVNAPITGSVSILNRWGNTVYSSDVKANNKGTIKLWDGKTNQQEVVEGTYYYRFQLTDLQGKELEMHGFVEVVR